MRTDAGKYEKASHMMDSVMAGHLADMCRHIPYDGHGNGRAFCGQVRTGAGKDEKASHMMVLVMAGHLADTCGHVRTGAGKCEKASHMMVW